MAAFPKQGIYPYSAKCFLQRVEQAVVANEPNQQKMAQFAFVRVIRG